MYKVLVVDDEMASLKHICNIITTKCRDFAVVDTARNGEMALQKVQEHQPDVIFSDVMMPLMNGIELITEVKEKYPEILTVIVSGYNDFKYVKGAIQQGVCEYILKPVRPSDVVALMENLHGRLDRRYYERRMRFLKKASGGMSKVDEKELESLFPDERYYAAIYRKNGLPSRFSQKFSAEVYSIPQEKVIIYGRDEMEALYLCPARLLNGESFEDYFKRVYQKVQEKDAFYTAIIREEAFEPKQLPAVLKRLYRRLDESIVTGKTQILLESSGKRAKVSYGQHSSFEMLEHYVRKKDASEMRKELQRLFEIWKSESCPQIWLEEKIHYLLIHFAEKGYIEEFSEFVLDDIFAEAVSMEELEKSVMALMSPEAEPELSMDRNEKDYRDILWYIDEHLAENITVQTVCRKFALSQAVLSKIFHKYAECSFSNYLTRVRMERAQKILRENPGILIRDVAERVGYADQFYFSRVFRSYWGISPSEYLEKQGNSGKKEAFQSMSFN